MNIHETDTIISRLRTIICELNSVDLTTHISVGSLINQCNLIIMLQKLLFFNLYLLISNKFSIVLTKRFRLPYTNGVCQSLYEGFHKVSSPFLLLE